MRLVELVQSGNFVRVMEMFPPNLPSPELMTDSQKYDLSLRFEKLAEGIGKLESLADAFSLPELKDAQRVHLNSIGIAAELKRATGNEIIPTLTLRDSNRQNLLGAVAFATYAGINNILIVRGDPYNENDKSNPKNVYDVRKISSLVRTVRSMEDHMTTENGLCIVTPFNLARSREPEYLTMMKAREESGVDIFLAEQMFEDLDTYFRRIEVTRNAGITLPIVHTIFPFKSYEDAANCIAKFGWNISEKELHDLKTHGPQFGLEMARRRYHALMDNKDIAQGVCISTRGSPETARLITA